jgi:hypothetical protein
VVTVCQSQREACAKKLARDSTGCWVQANRARDPSLKEPNWLVICIVLPAHPQKAVSSAQAGGMIDTKSPLARALGSPHLGRTTMKGRFWITDQIAPAVACAAAFLIAVAGCGGGEGKTDQAVVLPSDPLATNTSSGPSASSGGGGGGAPTTSGDKAPSTAPAATAGGAEGWGTIKGRVVLVGDPPTNKVLDTKIKDPEVCATKEHRSERLIVDPETKGVRNAIVYIPRPTKVNPEAKKTAEATDADFDQKECVFIPHALAVMKGAKIILKSSDPVNHNINAKLRVNSLYNNIVRSGEPLTYDPPAAERGPIEVTCDIHGWMKAFWLILDNPYFAVTDDKGNFEIKDVPAGGQKLVVWQEALDKNSYLTSPSGDPITVKANDTTTLPDFKIEKSRVRPE